MRGNTRENNEREQGDREQSARPNPAEQWIFLGKRLAGEVFHGVMQYEMPWKTGKRMAASR